MEIQIDLDVFRCDLLFLVEEALHLDLPLQARHRLADVLDKWLADVVDEIIFAVDLNLDDDDEPPPGENVLPFRRAA